ncbi:hypothetical protein FF1_008237 [Malus domestica]
MGSELIFRGHEADQHVADTYSPKRPKPWASVTRPIQYLLREQRLVFILVGIVIATVGFTILPSSTSRSPYASGNVPITNEYVRYDFDSSATTQYKPAYERRFGLNSWGSSGKVPLGLKRKGLRIVVTGGAGFVGSHLVDRLIARGDSVIVVDNFFTGRKENVMHHFRNPRFELIRHDVVEPLLLEVDQIYHLACPASPVHYKFNPVKTIISFATIISFNWSNSHFLGGYSISANWSGLNFEFLEMHKTNVVGTLNMLGLAKRIGARFLLTSTSEVYGDPLQHPQVETYWGNVNPIGEFPTASRFSPFLRRFYQSLRRTLAAVCVFSLTCAGQASECLRLRFESSFGSCLFLKGVKWTSDTVSEAHVAKSSSDPFRFPRSMRLPVIFGSTHRTVETKMCSPRPAVTKGVRSCYDEGKRTAETLTMDYHRGAGVEVRIARIFNTYGPRMCIDDGRVVSNFVAQALRKEPMTVYGDGKQTRSFQYVSDLVEGLMRLMEGEHVGPFNLGNPGEFTMLELAKVVQETIDPEAKIEYRPNTEDDPHKRKPDITKAKDLLGWQPKVSLQKGLPLMVSDFRKRIFGDHNEADSTTAL